MSEKPPVPAALQTLLLICETDQFQYARRVAIGLDALTGSPAEHDATLASSRDARTDPLAQEIPLKLRQRRHQGGDQFALPFWLTAGMLVIR